MTRKPSQRERIVAELAAIRNLQQNPPTFFRDHDRRRLAERWAKKTSKLVELELAAYGRKPGR